MEGTIRIKKAENGYRVCVMDPEIIQKNQTSDGAYKDPEREFIFKDREEVVTFLQENMDSFMPDMDDGMGKEFAKLTNMKE